MRLLIATDAWRPQVNGVVRTLERTGEQLQRLGVQVTMLSPAEFRTWPMPTYPEIRLARAMPGTIAAAAAAARPEAVHIATEGPIGFAVALFRGELPLAFGATILMNDLIWWIPFAVILYQAYWSSCVVMNDKSA